MNVSSSWFFTQTYRKCRLFQASLPVLEVFLGYLLDAGLKEENSDSPDFRTDPEPFPLLADVGYICRESRVLCLFSVLIFRLFTALPAFLFPVNTKRRAVLNIDGHHR